MMARSPKPGSESSDRPQRKPQASSPSRKPKDDVSSAPESGDKPEASDDLEVDDSDSNLGEAWRSPDSGRS
jgi:hypothetical protein